MSTIRADKNAFSKEPEVAVKYLQSNLNRYPYAAYTQAMVVLSLLKFADTLLVDVKLFTVLGYLDYGRPFVAFDLKYIRLILVVNEIVLDHFIKKVMLQIDQSQPNFAIDECL